MSYHPLHKRLRELQIASALAEDALAEIGIYSNSVDEFFLDLSEKEAEDLLQEYEYPEYEFIY